MSQCTKRESLPVRLRRRTVEFSLNLRAEFDRQWRCDKVVLADRDGSACERANQVPQTSQGTFARADRFTKLNPW